MRRATVGVRRRGTRCLATLLAGALILAACNGEEVTEDETEDEAEPPEPATDEAADLEGETVRVAVELGDSLAEPIKPHVERWEEDTGASVEFIEIPFAEIFGTLMTSFQAGSDDYDVVIVLPTWLGDMAGGGFLEPLDDRIEGDDVIDWDDVLPVCQDIVSWEAETFIMPMDCDLFMAYYNAEALADGEHQDAFESEYGYALEPPQTWEQYRDIAEYFQQDEEIFGAMESMSRDTQTFWTGLSRMIGYVSQGEGWELFFDPDDMTPLIDSPGHVQALEDWLEITELGPPDILEFDVGDIRQQFPFGEAALALDWASIGMIPGDREQQELVGFAQIPGPEEVYDHGSGDWEELDEPNQVPFMAANGWGAAIPEASSNKDAAWELIRYLSSPQVSLELVSMRDNFGPATGYQPFRESHFEDLEGWVESEWEEDVAEEYLDETYSSLTADFVQPDLRIPGAFEYLDALDAGLTDALAGRTSPEEALSEVAEQWDQITDENDRDEQLRLYRASIGLDE
jgi:multiple sugar transport system substrate-binding protein